MGEIHIEPDLPPFREAAIFLHELMHAVDYTLVRQNVRKRGVPHDWIIHAAPNLLAALVRAGLWRGLTEADLRRHRVMLVREGRHVRMLAKGLWPH